MSLLCVENFDSAPWYLLKLSPINHFQKENLLEPGLIYLQPRPQGAFPWWCGWRPPPGKSAPETRLLKKKKVKGLFIVEIALSLSS